MISCEHIADSIRSSMFELFNDLACFKYISPKTKICYSVQTGDTISIKKYFETLTIEDLHKLLLLKEHDINKICIYRFVGCKSLIKKFYEYESLMKSIFRQCDYYNQLKNHNEILSQIKKLHPSNYY
jgi:hypothetical protein